MYYRIVMVFQSFQLIISILILILSFIVYLLIVVCTDSDNFCSLFGGASKGSVNLVVLVLSARSNFDKRKVLRETWFNNYEINDLSLIVKPYFIIGDHDCLVPNQFREDQFACSSWFSNETEDLKSNISIYKAVPIDSHSNQPVNPLIFNGFSFKVHQDILLKRIGCLSSFACDHIILKNVVSQEILFNKSFIASDQAHGYDYQDSSPMLLLPRGFIGLLIAIGKDDSVSSSKKISSKWNQFTKLIQILRLYDDLNDFQSKLFNGYDQTATSFIIELSDQNEYRLSLQSHQEIHANYISSLNSIEKNLQNEITQFNDILLVDVVDVYRNLSLKLVNGISLIVHLHTDADFILKTDDDCFIDLNQITSKLKSLPSKKLTWWGNFRRNSLINIYGKWSENDFPGSVYPSFACGSGYVITMDIAKWITRNQDYLHYFQGEDVSMGIWLSSIIPTYLMDRDWACAEDAPRNNLLAYCQLDSSQILQFYKIKSSEKHQRLYNV